MVGRALYENKFTLAEAFEAAGAQMIARRIIPCLDVKDGRVVKGVQFVALRDAGDPVEQAARLRRGRRRRAVLPRHHRVARGREIIYDVVARTAEQVFMPLTVGGGVRKVEDVRRAAPGRRRQGRDQHRGRRAIPS